MKSELPKQFMLLLDAPILMHTMERFSMADEAMELILVLPQDQFGMWKSLCKQMDFDIPHQLVAGGETRYDSVKAGLALCPSEGVVGIHDGVRPLVSVELIQLCYATAKEHGSALPVVPVTQSLRKRDSDSSQAMDRTDVVAVQTPQCFQLDALKACYEGEAQAHFTDDATVFESFGHKVHLIDGEETNIKVTTPSDLKIAEAILEMSRGEA